MRKLLVEGTCEVGYAGSLTRLVDFFDTPLYTGDLVAIFHYDINNYTQYKDFCGLAFVCSEELQEWIIDKRFFVMGLAAGHFCSVDNRAGGVVQNHQEWRLQKVKGFADVVDGETWGGVRCIVG